MLAKNIEIKSGDSIMWDSPTTVPEPHSVSFVKENNSFGAFRHHLLFLIQTEFKSLDSASNAEPLFAPPQPGEPVKTVITVNAKSVPASSYRFYR